ncbi:hypothetical protein [Streptomyces sp. MNU89]|uniref:hypothetical protein n=1 Tax=Streptomyces sp. MNU89 TaxID=2560025 RepID=UPI001E600FE2|nr:hypothetical protein [Streptomyces sp. MNU89]MCC9742562.1 hypothetical protein [Streptomyces sp. MNU89]
MELPTCTVRFPVPGEIGYALTDAAEAVRGEMVALAVWAFRAADEAGTGDGSVEVHPLPARAAPPAAASLSPARPTTPAPRPQAGSNPCPRAPRRHIPGQTR